MNETKDGVIYRKRLDFLKNLIIKEFPNAKIEYDDSGSLIKVTTNGFLNGKEITPNIVFHPEENFMTDADSDENVFHQAIQLAKQILNNPPIQNRNNQGEILLKSGGAIFKERAN